MFSHNGSTRPKSSTTLLRVRQTAAPEAKLLSTIAGLLLTPMVVERIRFLAAFVCLLKTAAARITKLDIYTMNLGNLFSLCCGQNERSKVKATWHKTVPLWVFALLWVPACSTVWLKNNTLNWLLIIFSANVHRSTKFVHCQIPEKILYTNIIKKFSTSS